MVVTMCPIIISSRTRPDSTHIQYIISNIIFIKVNKIHMHDLHNEPNKSITARKQDYTIKVNYNVRLIISIIITYMIIIIILYWRATIAAQLHWWKWGKLSKFNTCQTSICMFRVQDKLIFNSNNYIEDLISVRILSGDGRAAGGRQARAVLAEGGNALLGHHTGVS